MTMSHDDACTPCELSGRREFLARLGSSLAAIGLWLGTPELDAAGTTAMAPLAVDGARKSYDVPATDGVRIDKDAEVILVRQQHSVWAFALSCPHQNTALRWNPRDQRFQCPKHKSKYQPNGVFIEGRATRA
ncbi:MAG: Rieske 2Fe-2S domain-containing protein, partial [Gemmatimonadetes bacterium]|nr:Rieske 2Fe-2S domain-containing protein [Gemmatimonadota bacterium]